MSTIMVDAEALRKALRELGRVVDRRATMPILANVRLEADGPARLRLVGTDLRVWLTVDVEATGNLPACTVPAKALQTALGKHKGPVGLAWDGQRLSVEAGATATIMGRTARDFPRVPDGAPETCRFSDEAPALFDYVARAAGTDEARGHLCGVLLEREGAGCVLVATDGHRLHHADLPFEGTVPDGAETLIPVKAVALVARAKGAVSLGVAGGWATFRHGASTLTAKLVDAKFPPWRQVVPADDSASWSWEAEGHGGQIAALFREIGAFALSPYYSVDVQADGNDLVVGVDNPEVGERSGRVGLRTLRPVAEGFTIGFGAHLIDEAVCDLGDRVRLRIGGRESPAKFSNGNRYAVVMPTRVR